MRHEQACLEVNNSKCANKEKAKCPTGYKKEEYLSITMSIKFISAFSVHRMKKIDSSKKVVVHTSQHQIHVGASKSRYDCDIIHARKWHDQRQRE